MKNGIVNRTFITKIRYTIKLIDKIKLDLFLEKEYQIISLEKYIVLLGDKNITRAHILSASNDDKLKIVNTLYGYYFASYDNVEIQINNEPYNINTPSGSSLFISTSAKIQIPESVLVVGVENAENLNFIKKQSYLFSQYPKQKLFVFRSPIMLEWIKEIKNEYLHYGDFDFAGISIYIHQIGPRLSNKSSFFIPKNIEFYLTQGNTNLYDNQIIYKESIIGFDNKIDYLVQKISDSQKG